MSNQWINGSLQTLALLATSSDWRHSHGRLYWQEHSKKNANFFKPSEDLHLIELRNSVKDCVDLVHNAIVTYEDFLIVDDNIEILQMRIFWNTWKDRRPIITINLQMRKLWKQTTSIQFRVYRIHTRVEAFYQSLWQRKLYDVFCFKSNRSFF